MKLEKMNNKAKEAYANSLIKNSESLINGIFLTIIVAPFAYLLKSLIDPSWNFSELWAVIEKNSTIIYPLVVIIYGVGIYMAYSIRKQGLKVLSQIVDHN
ncbi:hypothetical protein [Spartinivicinus poritis]|uniref:Uncharacterized protein n=1 Tax=Spartinivicinus poritis TaxID=2994640 RepID=A0ABT5UGK9_9GAMM|nr:hypothetical protein [Spartinivicinus sp. A2-2]MDE1465515.1 hypothetical protein [Spartinivicinus sp. A2-2]